MCFFVSMWGVCGCRSLFNFFSTIPDSTCHSLDRCCQTLSRAVLLCKF
uniref:Uncharacterized protein n=1 Tax=Anguilla anguilla TaxID=7936 RepID=A0A0E9T780_ANGAN